MNETADKTCCVVDNGLFTELAVTLSPHFKQVLYTSPWEAAFPRSNAVMPGQGIPEVIRIESIWPHIDEIDLFVFPDIFHGPLQVYLRSLGKRVWGSGLAEQLEFERGYAKRTLRQLGLPVGPYRTLVGINELRRYLANNEGESYVKISRTRGDMETFKVPESGYRLIEPRLDELEHSLGARKSVVKFIVEEPIEAKTEVGYDAYTVDGKYPSQALFGVEIKDAGYLGQVVPYAAMPRAIGRVNMAMKPYFQQHNYRGFWSSEIRIDKQGTPYLIDPCCRMASPPGELYQYLIENLADVIWHGAAGEMVEPQYKHQWGAQLVLRSAWAEKEWQPIEFPEEYRQNIKLHYLTMIRGSHYYVPQVLNEMAEIGAVVAGGNTQQEAIDAVTKIAQTVQGYDVEYRLEALEQAGEGMDRLAKAA